MTHNHVKSKSDHGMPSLETLQNVEKFGLEWKVLRIATWFGLCPHLLILIVSLLGLHTLVRLPFSPATQAYSHLRTSVLAASSDKNALRPSSHEPCCSRHSGRSSRATSSESFSWPLNRKYLLLLLRLQSTIFIYVEIITTWHHVIFSFAYCLSPLSGRETQTLALSLLTPQFLGQCLYSNICWVITHARWSWWAQSRLVLGM